MTTEMRNRIAAWRALPEAERTRRLRAQVVDEVVGNMAMEGEPVSAEWTRRARARQSEILSA